MTRRLEILAHVRKQKQADSSFLSACFFSRKRFDRFTPSAIISVVKSFFALALAFCVLGCASQVPPTVAPVPTAIPSTPTVVAIPTSTDIFYNAPSSYSRQLGNHTQTIRLGVSPDFAARPILPFYGLSLRDEKFVANLFEAITYNHFFRWQEADWSARANIKYDDFKQRLAAGEDLSYPAMDTRDGGANAHLEKINPAADIEILMIPHHDGLVTFPGSPTDPGLSIKNTINADGSVKIRVPLVYSQVITYKPGDVEIQNIARTSILLGLMQLGIPPDAIAHGDLKAIKAWYETQPEKDLHSYQYEYLKKLLTDENDESVLKLWDVKP